MAKLSIESSRSRRYSVKLFQMVGPATANVAVHAVCTTPERVNNGKICWPTKVECCCQTTKLKKLRQF